MHAAVGSNLGCEDKILRGYANVDVVLERAGKLRAVICNICRIENFYDDSADQILVVQAVEHFWRWEAVEILPEWGRALKSGGRG